MIYGGEMVYTFEFKTDPKGAKVYLGSVAEKNYIGTTPFSYGKLDGNYYVYFVKEGYDILEDVLTPKDSGRIITYRLRKAEVPVVPVPVKPVVPGYPKTISRGIYSFPVRNSEQEAAIKDFLGIEPAGVDLDAYLSKLDEAGFESWAKYWERIFGNVGMLDPVILVTEKKNYYLNLLKNVPAVPVEYSPTLKQMCENLRAAVLEKNKSKVISALRLLFTTEV